MTKIHGFQNRRIIINKFVKNRANGYWYKARCLSCLREFEIEGYKFKEGKGSFCSKRCYGDYVVKKRKYIEYKCLSCGIKFIYLKSKPRKYCSQRCMGSAYENEGNPSWKGGTSRLPYNHKFRDRLKMKIRERDKYTCYMCGRKNLTSFNAHVHHIDFNKINCEFDNLITICRWCHGSVSALRKNIIVNNQTWMPL